MKTKLSHVSCQFGAPMGRADSIPDDIETAGKLYLEKLKWVDGDYDGSAYWGRTFRNGVSEYIYRASGETKTEQIEIFVRAINRYEAKELVKTVAPNAKFFR